MICATDRCPRPARWTVRSTDRGRTACDHHLEQARRWAAATGPPTVTAIEGAPPAQPDPDALF